MKNIKWGRVIGVVFLFIVISSCIFLAFLYLFFTKQKANWLGIAVPILVSSVLTVGYIYVVAKGEIQNKITKLIEKGVAILNNNKNSINSFTASSNSVTLSNNPIPSSVIPGANSNN